MFKRSGLIVLCLCFISFFNSAAQVASDNDFLQILKLNDRGLQDRKLITYIRAYYRHKPLDSLQAAKTGMNYLLIHYRLNARPQLNYFIDYLYHQRLGHIDSAESSLMKAIQLVAQQRDKFMLYVFYNELGFLQTDRGNITEAVYSYSLARKAAVMLDNASYQVIVDVNISDVFYHHGFYTQSLSYLNQAQAIVAKGDVPEQGLKNLIYNNTAENYFRMGNADSLKKYNRLLHAGPDSADNKHVFVKLTDYYLSLLQHDYQGAVKQIRTLKSDSLYSYNDNDDQNLADAYYHANMPDSAKRVLTTMLGRSSLKNHPEVKYHLYQVLGQIAEQQQQVDLAANNYKLSLQQSKEQITRLTQVDNIVSKIKIDEAEDIFLQKEEIYKRERLGLIYGLVLTLLTIVVITMIFRANRQKRYYERLVFDAKKKELSFINSHEVRRHLCNLLGLIDVIKNSDDKPKEYLDAETYILQEAESLDDAIKVISEKLEVNTISVIKATD